MSIITVGLDMSLTGTGICVVEDQKVVDLLTFSTKPADYSNRYDRVDAIVERCAAHMLEGVKVVCIEEPFVHSKNINGSMMLTSLGWEIRKRLYRSDVPVIDVAATRVKKFATGKGGGIPKDQITKEVYKRWGVDAKDNNQADAVVLAMIGQCWASRRNDNVFKWTKPQLEVVEALEIGGK